MKKAFIFSIISLISMVANAYDFEVNGIYYNVLSANDKTVEVTKNVGDTSDYTGIITIPKTVAYQNITFNIIAIGKKAFYYSTVTTVNLPESITTIDQSAFCFCENLQQCNLPHSLTSIRGSAFYEAGLDSVYVPGNVTELGQGCFGGSKLLYLELGEGISDIHIYTIPGRNLKTIVLPSSLARIEAGAFYQCKNVRTLISKRVTTPTMYGKHYEQGGYGTGTYYNPFDYSNRFQRFIYTLMVPKGSKASYANYKTSDGNPGWPAATIEEYDESTDFSKISTEFMQEDKLYAITNTGNNNTLQLVKTMVDSVKTLVIRDKIIHNSIEYSITSINPNYISTNKELGKVYSYSNVPISVHENTFSANTKLFGTLYVPEGTKDLYENATEWTDFTNIIETDEVIPPSPNPKCSAPTISYLNGELIFECETENVKFVSSVICKDNKNHDASIVPLTAIYYISVYATKDGYDDSDIVEKEISIRGLKGDVNEDGEINIADINSTIGIILGQ